MNIEEEAANQPESSKQVTIVYTPPSIEEISLDKKLEMMEQKMGEESKNRRIVR